MVTFWVRYQRRVLTGRVRWSGGALNVRKRLPNGIRAGLVLFGSLCSLGVRLLLLITRVTR